MKVKKDGGFYNIDFIDSQLEISDINNILQDHLIKFNLQNEDETPKIQIISDVNTYSVLIFVEKGFELHIDKENYLTKVFVQSSVGNLNLYSQNSIYKRKNILNTQFEFIEVTFLNENNEIIELKDFFSISLFIK